MTPTLKERMEGGLMGLLIGDALGVPYEFHAPEEIPPLEEIEMQPPPGFPRSHAGTPTGTWSDDGAQALALLASLLERGRFDEHDFAHRLLSWYDEGYMAVDNRVFDVGNQTRVALTALRQGASPLEAGPRTVEDNGNGALMRVLPLALWHREDDASLAHDAMQQSLLTHGHTRSRICSAIYCLWARATLEGADEAWTAATRRVKRVAFGQDDPFMHLLPSYAGRPSGTGYVVDSLLSARWAVRKGNSYAEVVRLAISLGHDTDTTACLAGGIAGSQYGIEGIPLRWREQLRGREIVRPLVERLLAHIEGAG